MKKLALQIITALFPLLLGFLILLFPSRVIAIVFLILAFFLLFSSARELYVVTRYFLRSSRRLFITGALKNGINIILSLIIIYLSLAKPHVLGNIIIYLFALDLLLSGAVGILDSVKLKKLGIPSTLITSAVSSVIFAVFLFLFPSFIQSVVMTVIAIILIVVGTAMVVSAVAKWNSDRKNGNIDVTYEEKS